MTEDEEKVLSDQIRDLQGDIKLLEQNLCYRVKFLEKLVFGFVGVLILGVLTAIGGVVIWAIGAMGIHKGP